MARKRDKKERSKNIVIKGIELEKEGRIDKKWIKGFIRLFKIKDNRCGNKNKKL